MEYFFKKIPLPLKLILIGLIPFLLLLLVSAKFYSEKTKNVRLLENYIGKIEQSARINELVNDLQKERKYSFDYAITNTGGELITKQRLQTDSIIEKLQEDKDSSLLHFTGYTFLDSLQSVRSKIDKGAFPPGLITHYYTTAMFRINTLNTVSPGTEVYLEPVYKDLLGQKLLSEMIVELSIMRSNIYNALYTKQYFVETLLGTIGVYDVQKTYEKEFLLKASPAALESYQHIRETGSLKAVNDYLDKLFKNFQADSSYTAAEWWKISDEGISQVMALQQQLWSQVDQGTNAILHDEKKDRNRTLLFLSLAALFVVCIAGYTIYTITKILRRLRRAANAISNGITDVPVEIYSNDIIGDLSQSILRIGSNNKTLAEAAENIGNGNFNINITPRSDKDLLGNSIVKMKNNLQQFTQLQKESAGQLLLHNAGLEEKVKKRTLELVQANKELESFSFFVAHDLRTPLRTMQSYASLLKGKYEQDTLHGDEKKFLDRITASAKTMEDLIEDLLAFARIGTKEIDRNLTDMTALAVNVLDELGAGANTALTVTLKDLPPVQADTQLMKQVLINLLSNAMKYSSKKKHPVIEISAMISDGLITYSVSDNGAGFDMQYAGKLFGAFQRLHNSEEFEGTGLGLAIVQRIIQKHKGKVWAESIAGEGAKFYFSLPGEYAVEKMAAEI